MSTILKIENLSVDFAAAQGFVRAVDGLSLELSAGKTLALVGESGSGKSVTALSVMRLLDNAFYPEGRILFQGDNLLSESAGKLRQVRGAGMSMIFQEPMTSLNPVMRTGDQITEAVLAHQKISRKEAEALTLKTMYETGLPEPEKRFKEFPHQLSGGMKQRVMIAMALVCQPKILIADEPTTALDVTIQAQIMELILKLKKERGTSVLLITHDIGLVASYSDDTAVLYGGRLCEYGSTRDVLTSPRHPYTRALLESLPAKAAGGRLKSIPGTVPSLGDFSAGCRFSGRCTRETEMCARKNPLPQNDKGRIFSCHAPWLDEKK